MRYLKAICNFFLPEDGEIYFYTFRYCLLHSFLPGNYYLYRLKTARNNLQ